MYLKRISLFGFKSFADRVDFDFSPGVTCIVGPNGCGKSNVVDAFKWVLGEQSAKMLRGRQMGDMIFNGSATRRATGMAEVNLYFDNSDRMLALDYDEIRITRKLYRTGESEYWINNELARLKDVRELFLDSGVGADTYSVIEQGRVSHLLEASSEERRAIFEEAAGVGKYKVRKREAERKLERTQQNLLRLNDIVDEVEKRLRSVKVQAGKARNFQVYDVRLKELRAGFSMAEYHRLTEALEHLAGASSKLVDASTGVRTDIARQEAETVKLAEAGDRLGEELAAVEQEMLKTRSEMATHEERVAAAERRIGEQRTLLGRIDGRREQLSAQKEEHSSKLTEVQDAAAQLQTQTHGLDARIRELTQQDQSLSQEMAQTHVTVEDEKAGIIDLVRRSAQLRNEIASLTAHTHSLEAEQGRLGARHAVVRQQIDEHLANRTALDARIAELDALIAAQTARLADKRAEAERLDAERADASDVLGRTKEERSALRSRLEVFNEWQRTLEGVDAGVRALLERKAANPDDPTLVGIAGMVGELFETDVSQAHIIEAAIGELDQHLVLTDSRAFLANYRQFEELPGRINVICVDRLPPVIREHDYRERPGFVGNAVDLIRYSAEYEMLAAHLLSKTVVVDTLETALAWCAEDLWGRRFVTLAGELVEPNGCVSIGPAASRAQLITRKSQQRELTTRLEDADRRIAELADRLGAMSSEAAHLTAVEQELRGALYEANTARIEANTALAQLQESLRRLSEEQPLIAGEANLIGEQIAETRRRTEENAASARRLDEENSAREQRVAGYLTKIEALAEERDRVRYALMEDRVAVGKLAEKRAAMADTINQLRRALRTTEEALSGATHEGDDATARIADSEEVILSGRSRLSELAAAGERLEADGMQRRRQREMVRVETEGLAAATKACRSRLEEIEHELHQRGLEQQEAHVRREALVIRVREELGLDLAEKYPSFEPAEQDWPAVEAEIAELRQKIERLGNVNLDALSELGELEQREEFLTTQRADLDDSRRQLEELIRRLDQESTERFTQSFETIREHFRELFRKLFGGGKADIVLENPDDVLGSGVEILAKPPGKELQRISLMSGGEKTMTAIALVMSIFRSKPAPFAILDEVDAALDEANNVRYNSLVREFLDRSQFIIVTHSKRTMSIADQLYGITMQEPGTSTRVSVRFEQDSTEPRHAVA